MKATPFSAYAIQLTRFGLVNCYLVREPGGNGEQGDSFTLIDTGVSGAGDAILAAAKAAGAPIRRVLLTHAHVDHVGSVDELMAKLPAGTVLAISTRSLPLLQQPPNKTLDPGEPVGEIKGGLPGIVSQPTHLIAEGELFGSLRCIETPGHIPGHFSFLDERDGTLYAGDALVGVRRLAIPGFCHWYFPLPNGGTWNREMARASARKLLGLPIERFACGHGRVQEGGTTVLREVVDAAGRVGL
ncbi:MBL fold metallo-hydrolase [Granulicella sp. WH15]|uniref:MBL fold metallo-hydrolase n=1 Tax=Granulicella sp. WH15 TaxID=2602070 RepID=UPI001366CF58|nr:MBL fold metallo-hydrolase [Granulicella sp. WH15]QHN01977.1 MBL fold metallo-hydrolase [Granulicella sp. WH15]